MAWSRILAAAILAWQTIAAVPAPRPLALLSDTPVPTGAAIRLVDCNPREPLESPDSAVWLSLVIYCDKIENCNDVNYVPAARDICVKKSSNVSLDYQKWQSSDWQRCYFAERGAFSWALSKFAMLFPPETEVGIGEDADENGFRGFTDDELQGAGPATHNCSKMYYFIQGNGTDDGAGSSV
ncbi:hypothetical protein QBC47DRAFT_407278 [Echria macrotheca]|uniref:Uncharacterized protein n=1 Tax=Echria macrotheca TaxID=438768 RepID=A0AAJ0B3C9_9PEZI|nr:hypothetical protein QBC47DRAFT_407278 [Echria macrotheca]